MKLPKLNKRKTVILMIILGIVVIGVLKLTGAKNSNLAPDMNSSMPTNNNPDDDNLTVDANLLPAQYAELSFPELVTGKVNTIEVKEGDVVKKGQLLLRLGAEVALDAQDQALDKLNQAKVKLKKAQVNNTNSLDVKKISARLELAEAIQKLDLLEAKPTTGEVAIGEQAIKDAQAKLSGLTGDELLAAQYALSAAQNALVEIKKGASANELSVATIELEKAQKIYNDLQDGIGSDSEELLVATKAEVTLADLEYKKAKSEVTKYELRSPIDGKIAYVGAKEGETSKGGTILIRVANTNSWELKTNSITEAEVYKILPGQKVKIIVDAIPKIKFDGTVKSVENFGNTEKGEITYPVVVTIDQKDDRFRWGMLASIVFPVK